MPFQKLHWKKMLFLLTDVTLADEDSNSKPEAQRTQGIESTS